MPICQVRGAERESIDAQAQDAAFRLLAAAILRQAIDDLAVPVRRAQAQAFLIHVYPTSLWREWLGFVTGHMVRQVVTAHDGRRFRRGNTGVRKARGPYKKRVTR